MYIFFGTWKSFFFFCFLLEINLKKQKDHNVIFRSFERNKKWLRFLSTVLTNRLLRKLCTFIFCCSHLYIFPCFSFFRFCLLFLLLSSFSFFSFSFLPSVYTLNLFLTFFLVLLIYYTLFLLPNNINTRDE
jgi:hypothetical protein